jgi:hypothetical protein
LSSLKKWISCQYLHLVQAENICLKSALEGKSDVSLIRKESSSLAGTKNRDTVRFFLGRILVLNKIPQ